MHRRINRNESWRMLNGETHRLSDRMVKVLSQCEIYRASKTAPHLPQVGTSAASSYAEMPQVDLLFLGGATALHAMDMYDKYSLVAHVH